MPTSPSGSSKADFVSKVLQTITTHRMIAEGDSVLVAASGGPDSSALLHALFQISKENRMPIAAAHLHHGLRAGEADRDAEAAGRQAALLGVPFFVEQIDVEDFRERHGLSVEDAARKVRYDFLHRTADRGGFSKIAVGHHADDSVESMLMFFFRGAGPRGLSGILPVRGRVIRPLIERRRDEIRSYLARQGLSFVVDSTNEDRRFLRNRIRHELIPLLTANYNPNLTETLLRLSTVLRDEEHWLAALAEKALAETLIDRDESGITLSVPALAALPAAARRRVIRSALSGLKGDLRRIGFRHVEAICRLSMQQKASGELHLPGNIGVYRSYERLRFHRSRQPAPDASEDGYRFLIDGPGEVRIPGRGALLRLERCERFDPDRMAQSGQRVAFFDMGKLYFPLTVRSVRPGDRFRPLGMAGSQKLSDFFVNQKVPRHLRGSCPVMVCGGKIAWVIGHRIAEDFRADAESQAVLRAELLAEPL
jgi:tRNA(Ile)-lysidine synthase